MKTGNESIAQKLLKKVGAVSPFPGADWHCRITSSRENRGYHIAIRDQSTIARHSAVFLIVFTGFFRSAQECGLPLVPMATYWNNKCCVVQS